MNAIKEARRYIERHPDNDSARVLASLVLALESDRSFELQGLYKLDYKAFDLAIDVLREWRLDRYYAGKAKLFDLSMQVSDLPPGAPDGKAGKEKDKEKDGKDAKAAKAGSSKAATSS